MSDEWAGASTGTRASAHSSLITSIKSITMTRPPFRLIFLLYGLTALLALPAAWSMFATLTAEAGQSLAPLQMLNGFNYTVYSDFMHNSGRAISPLVRVSLLTTLLALLGWTWATGGILYSFQMPFRAESFWQVSTHYLGRYVRLLGVTALFSLAVFLVPFLIGILLAVAFEDSFTERGLFWLGFGGFVVGGLGTLLVWCIADYAKVLMYRTDEHSAFRAYGQAGRFVLTHLRPTFGRYLLLVALGAALLGTYLLLSALIPARNWALILLLLLVQQAVIVGRVVLKVLTLRVAYEVSSKRG